jgi:hypothetical protein
MAVAAAPYVDEEVAWAVEKHEALRYFTDESVGYTYPEAYIEYFGADYDPPNYISSRIRGCTYPSLVYDLSSDYN